MSGNKTPTMLNWKPFVRDTNKHMLSGKLIEYLKKIRGRSLTIGTTTDTGLTLGPEDKAFLYGLLAALPSDSDSEVRDDVGNLICLIDKYESVIVWVLEGSK